MTCNVEPETALSFLSQQRLAAYRCIRGAEFHTRKWFGYLHPPSAAPRIPPYPDDVFFPLAVERSGHLHPTLISFVDTFLARCSDTQLQPSAKLDVLYSVGHSITYMTASFLKVAAFSLTPTSLKSLFPPPPFIPPLRWAHGTLFHAPRHRTFGTASHSTGHSRRRASSKAFVVRSPQLTGRVTCDVAVDGLP
jgi:hypothetical protein